MCAACVEHRNLATLERTEYHAMCAACVELTKQHSITELGKSENPPSTFHYSFDFAQQLHYPANPLQPGPIFSKTPRKMQFFAVQAEGISRQMIYLIDEASSCGKEANVMISKVHHYLDNYGVTSSHRMQQGSTGKVVLLKDLSNMAATITSTPVGATVPQTLVNDMGKEPASLTEILEEI